jgi:hypothetical protein
MGVSEAFRVDRVHRHASADIALLELSTEISTPGAEPGQLFPYAVACGLEQFHTCGWPDIQGGSAIDGPPAPRLQSGTIERISLRIRDEVHHYWVGELSLKTRPGLSGAPVFRSSGQPPVLGLITESERHERPLEEFEEEREDGKVIRQLVEVTYTGYALLLYHVGDWLRERLDDSAVQV